MPGCSWHGITGEHDQYKLIAGDSEHPNENLYLFNDDGLLLLLVLLLLSEGMMKRFLVPFCCSRCGLCNCQMC